MTPHRLLRKGTLLIPTGPCHHLHVICNDPVFYPVLTKECFLAVNFSSIEPCIDCDTTCILHPGDHPFIKQESYVYYRKADIFGATTTSRLIVEGEIVAHTPCSDAVFEKILAGFLRSREVRPKIKTYLEKYCF